MNLDEILVDFNFSVNTPFLREVLKILVNSSLINLIKNWFHNIYKDIVKKLCLISFEGLKCSPQLIFSQFRVRIVSWVLVKHVLDFRNVRLKFIILILCIWWKIWFYISKELINEISALLVNPLLHITRYFKKLPSFTFAFATISFITFQVGFVSPSYFLNYS